MLSNIITSEKLKVTTIQQALSYLKTTYKTDPNMINIVALLNSGTAQNQNFSAEEASAISAAVTPLQKQLTSLSGQISALNIISGQFTNLESQYTGLSGLYVTTNNNLQAANAVMAQIQVAASGFNSTLNNPLPG